MRTPKQLAKAEAQHNMRGKWGGWQGKQVNNMRGKWGCWQGFGLCSTCPLQPGPPETADLEAGCVARTAEAVGGSGSEGDGGVDNGDGRNMGSPSHWEEESIPE